MKVIGQQGVADMFGVSRETIDNWQQQGLPVSVRGGPGVPSEYDSAPCVRWLIERELRKVRSESPNDRLARVRADAIEMDNAERRGTLIPADLLEPKLKAAMIAAREMLLNEPPRLARDAQGKTVQELEDMLSAAFEGFLTALSRWSDPEDDDLLEDGE
ncbi:MAG: terminase small subunit [Azoarcus sp.]|nr:terminase small subunit [Azoarcus sp.]